MDMEVEGYLRPPEMDLPPYPPKVVTLATGGKLIIRQASRADVPILLEAVRPTMKVERDFYDIVGARVYAELLGWYRHRVRDEFCLMGQIDRVEHAADGQNVSDGHERAVNRRQHHAELR